MGQPNKAQLEPRKRHRNKKFRKYINQVLMDSENDRLHGKLIVTFYDGEVRQVQVEKKVQNPDEELDAASPSDV